MAGDNPALYDSHTAHRILQRLNALEKRQNTLLGGGYNQSFPLGPPGTLWGITTTTNDYPTYPTSGNAVAVAFGTVDPSPLYPGSTPSLTFTAENPQRTCYATGWQSPLPFSGQLVALFWRNGQWYYVWPDLWRAVAGGTITAGSSGTVSLYQGSTNLGTRTAYYTWADSGKPDIANGDEIFIKWFDSEQRYVIVPSSTGAGTTPPKCYFYGFRLYRPTDGYRSGNDIQWNKIGSLYWINSIGNVSGCNLTVNTASVTAYTDWAIKVTADGWYEFDWRISGYEDIGNIDTGTGHGGYSTVTSTSAGAIGTHTHDYTSNSDTTSTSSSHTHTVLGNTTSADGAHSHTVTATGTTNAGGSASAHTHDTNCPHGYWHTYALVSIKWRASGGAEGDWDIAAVASTGTYVLPSSVHYGAADGSPYHSAAPRCIIFLYANTELVFRLQHAKRISDGDYNDLGYTFVQNAAYTNLTVTYHGNALSTASYYP